MKLAVSAVLALALAASDRVPAPFTIPRERGGIVVSVARSGAERWTADWLVPKIVMELKTYERGR